MAHRFLLAWMLVAAALCLRLGPGRLPLSGDNQLYFFASERAASGVPPHLSFVDSKNQLGVLVEAAAIAAGRRLGADDVMSSRAISIAFFAVSVAMAGLLAASIAGGAAAGHLAALALVAARGLANHAAAGSNVKVVLIAFILLAHLAIAAGSSRSAGERRLLDVVAGLAAGAAFACWQPALIIVVAVCLEASLVRGGGPRRALVVFVSSLGAVAAYELYFALHGTLGEQLHQAFVMPLGSVHRPAQLLRSLRFVLTEAGGPHGQLRIVPVAFALALGGALVAALRAPRRCLEILRERGGLISFGVAAAATTAFTLYDHQGVPDLFFVDPYFAVAFGVVVTEAVRLAVPGSARRRTTTVAALALTVVLVAQLHRDSAERRIRPWDLDSQRRLASAVRGYHDQLGSVWAYGALHLLALAHLDNHVALALFYDDVRDLLLPGWRPLRDGRMPQVIVDSRGLPAGLQGWLASEYREVTAPAFAAQKTSVWRRIEPAAAALEDSGPVVAAGRRQ